MDTWQIVAIIIITVIIILLLWWFLTQNGLDQLVHPDEYVMRLVYGEEYGAGRAFEFYSHILKRITYVDAPEGNEKMYLDMILREGHINQQQYDKGKQLSVEKW